MSEGDEGGTISGGARAFLDDSSQQTFERRLQAAVRGDSFWEEYLSQMTAPQPARSGSISLSSLSPISSTFWIGERRLSPVSQCTGSPRTSRPQLGMSSFSNG